MSVEGDEAAKLSGVRKGLLHVATRLLQTSGWDRKKVAEQFRWAAEVVEAGGEKGKL